MQFRVSLGTRKQSANDQQRPALADNVEAEGEGAILCVTASGHGLTSIGTNYIFLKYYLKLKLLEIAVKLPTERAEASLLRCALLANAAFSGVCGALIVVFDANLVAWLTEVDHELWPLGLMLIAFSASLLWFATRQSVSSAWVGSVW